MAKRKKSARPKPGIYAAIQKGALPLSEARKDLSSLVRRVGQQKGEVAISVRGQVEAYLVAAERVEEYRAEARPVSQPLRGSLRIVGDLEEGSGETSQALMDAARPLTGKG